MSDASQFIDTHFYAIEKSIPHIYLSALPFSDSDSRIAEEFLGEFSHLPVLQKSRPTVSLRRGNARHIFTLDVLSLAFSLDESKIFYSCNDGSIGVLDMKTYQLLSLPFIGHTKDVWCISLSPDGNYLASCSEDTTARIWDAKTGLPANPSLISDKPSEINAIAWSPNSNHLVCGCDNKSINIWDTVTGRLTVPSRTNHDLRVWSVAISPDGRRVVTGSDDWTLRVWDMESGVPTTGPLQSHSDGVLSVAISPKGDRIVSGSRDKTIRIWDIETGKQVLPSPITGHTRDVYNVKYSSDGNRIISCAGDRTIRVWNTESGSLVSEIPVLIGHRRDIMNLAISRSGNCIVSGSGDESIRVWNVGGGEILDPIIQLNQWLTRSTERKNKVFDSRILRFIEDRTNSDWMLGEDRELVLWVPKHYRSGIWTPHTEHIVGVPTVKIDLTDSVHGTEWTKCYTPRTDIT